MLDNILHKKSIKNNIYNNILYTKYIIKDNKYNIKII